MEILTRDIGALTIKREEEGKRFGPWPSPTAWNFDSILTAINDNDTSSSESGLGSKWNWKWEPINFKTPSINCPKALSTLLGRGYSATSPSGLRPSSCSIPTNGCTCQKFIFQSSAPDTSIHNARDNDANYASAPPSSVLAGIPPPTAVEILPEISPVGSPIGESSSLQSDQNRTRNANAEDNNDGSASQENAQSLGDGVLEEGQLSGEWLEEENLGDGCRQPSDLSEIEEQKFSCDYRFTLHDAAFSAQKIEENRLQNAGESRGVKRKRKKKKNKQQDQKEAKIASGFFAGSVKPQNNEQNQKKAQDDRGSFPGSEKLREKGSVPDIGANSRNSNGLKGKLKTSDSLDEKSAEKSVTDGGQIQEKGTAKKKTRIMAESTEDTEILTCNIGAPSIKREEDKERGEKVPPWDTPTILNFDSILTSINNNVNIHSNETSSSGSGVGFNWNWKWEPIDFKTSSINCPKALSTLLGRRYSATSPSGLCPSPCSIPTNGCTCQKCIFQSPIPGNTPDTNIHNGCDNDANHISAPFSSASPSIRPPIAVQILPETSPVGFPIWQLLSLQSDKSRTRDTNAEDNNDDSASNEDAQLLGDGMLEEGQISGEWLEEEDLGDECRKPEDSPEIKEQNFAYDYSFMVHDAGFSAQTTGEYKLQNTGKSQGVKRKRRKAKNKQQDQKKAKNGSGVFPGSGKSQNKQQNQLKVQDSRGSFPGSKKPQDKRSAQTSGVNSGSSNGLKVKLKTSESVDKKSTEKSVADGRQIQEKGKTKKNGEISLSSLLEGEICLWTTETVEEVLHDMKAEQIGNKKAQRRPLTAARKEKKKIKQKKKRALKNEQLGVKRLKLAPVIQSKPVVVCKFYVKGQCTQGKHCSFSHDTIPITKSEICKYHVNRCCLKGEECPFSHDLSGFPCKFYHSKGYCKDGDTCRFSHKPITGNALQEILRRDELEKQELCLQEKVQSSLCHVIANSMQNSDIQHEFSVGKKIENVTYVESSKAALESEQQLLKEKGASSAFPKLGKVTPGKSSNTALVIEQISKEKEANLQVPSILSFQQHEGFDYDIGAKGGNAALVAAKKAASMALAAVAGHEANLISRGLIRIPTFISHGDTDDDHVGSVPTDGEDIEVPEQSCDDLLEGGNHQIPPTRLLNSSKSAMKILEDLLCGNVGFDKDSRGTSTLGVFPFKEKKQKSSSDNG